ncbi:MAG TPA: DUF2391 family protein [Tepidisphaeraceae bacterium]|nr:DUF2391 family protein [Tepidisphaeraceae bacterium]
MSAEDRYGWREEGADLLRAVAAGSIVGMPLLYTMEMWWHGMTLSIAHLLVLLAATLVVNFCFSLLSGFRPKYSIADAAGQAVSAIGLGLIYSFAVLWLIGEVEPAAAGGAGRGARAERTGATPGREVRAPDTDSQPR